MMDCLSAQSTATNLKDSNLLYEVKKPALYPGFDGHRRNEYRLNTWIASKDTDAPLDLLDEFEIIEVINWGGNL